MMLTSSNEIILAVVEGNMLFWGGVAIVAGLWHMTSEAVDYAWTAIKRRRNNRRLDRILYGEKP